MIIREIEQHLEQLTAALPLSTIPARDRDAVTLSLGLLGELMSDVRRIANALEAIEMNTRPTPSPSEK